MTQIRLSQPLAKAADHYDVIVVGSGYGAAISASRLARAGRDVAVLERGREIRPGDYPRAMGDILEEAQVTIQNSGETLGRKDGLFDVRLNGDMNVLVGCGLGGTSLINANVSLEFDTRLMDYFGWPKLYRDNPDMLAPYFDRARKGLGATPYPDEYQDLPKLDALRQSARAMQQPVYNPPINVTFKDGANAFGFDQSACTLCGDCCTGCNYAAKNTTLMNYLPDAVAWGAQIFTGAEVSHLSKATHWQVHITGCDTPITAEHVILGAGTLGSTEILLRSAQKTDLKFSGQLGKRFSGNGDVLAFGYNANVQAEANDADKRTPLYGVGAGAHAPDGPEYQPGPVIAGVIDMRPKDRPVTEGLVIEDGILPGPLQAAWSAIFFLNEAVAGNMSRYGDFAMRLQDAADIGAAVQTDPTHLTEWSYKGPISRTQTYLVMSHDTSSGTITLDHGTGRAGVTWPHVGREPTYARDNNILQQAADGIWAEFMPNPIWTDPFGDKLITVHPIGGCVMGDGPEQGVVNAFGQVFAPAGDHRDADGQPVHDGLMVCDGATIPGALGVNPLLTISALTEHAMDKLAHRQGWRIDHDSLKPLPAATQIAEDAAAPALPDQTTAEMLAGVITILATIKHDIDTGDFGAARDAVIAAYDTVLAPEDDLKHILSDAILALLLTDGKLKHNVGPVIAEFMPILTDLERAITAKNYGQALKVLRDAMGDFSPGLAFSETMRGHISPSGLDRAHPISDAHAVAARDGAALGDDHAITGHFHIATDSLDAMLADETHPAILSGTIECDYLKGPFTIQDGATFELFKPNDGKVECWNMIYAGQISSGFFGHSYYFHGQKTLQKRHGSTWWGDVTTLAVDIHDGDSRAAPVVARGMMTLGLQDLAKQGSTLVEEFDAPDETTLGLKLGWSWFRDHLADKLEDPEMRADLMKLMLVKAAHAGHPALANLIRQSYVARFGALFANLIFRSYGGILSYLQDYPGADDAKRTEYLKTHPLTRKHPAPKPEHHIPRPEAGVDLALTRYNGGSKGPVILAPGFGVTAASYVMDTTDVNLTEYLCAQGYDVWLFDYRGSPVLKATQQPFTIDNVAQKDWPTAIRMVREATGHDVQIIAHCVGSMSLLMSLLKGVTGVRSVISSQTSLHPVTSWLNYAKADMHLASVLKDGAPKSMDGMIDRLGLDPATAELLKNGLPTVSMTTTDDPADPNYKRDKAIDAFLFNIPFPGEMPCLNPVCHRVFGVFGASYVHDQLNEATHNALRQVFGEVSSTPFLQLATIMRAGRAVDVTGADTYMTTPEKIRVPIDFIAGSRNQIFYPETTLRTLHWLQKTHPEAPKDMFSRYVFRNYGHMDLFVGRNSHTDIFPYLLERLEKRRQPG
ncbi:GMC family oxidoreductase N-terminal domain-containing protein [Actibacterium sp. 188UL27-1]|uniref:GMC family oxidoreductase N-terminal domain-containing protein n=1 Tax=Actibacterium sp. 188UL27-1 TaxID=2786961 RepID=UPI0019577703|nr:GMC family oxidoreductase N-terminal domain-containing protein [Actibacterium sp. 188UL27-1]MBM7068948.1 GMC family oxidoreductase N-terminal domain-containing protein [Actibacterium sp. 188UL27-1]